MYEIFDFRIDFFTFIFYNVFVLAFIAQSVECSLGKAEVTGSIPVVGSSNVSVRTFIEQIDMKSISKMVDFF